MESIIERNIYDLSKVTRVNANLLNFLIQHKMIPVELKERVEHEVKESGKGDLLYHHLKTRPEADFDVILKGLEESLNARAVDILKKGKNEDEPGTCGASTSKRNPEKPRMEEDNSYLQNFKTTKSDTLKWPISHGVLPHANNFAGRLNEIKQLESFYRNNNKLVLVCGLGGIGKTELTRKFMNDLNKKNVSRVWLHGDTFQSLKSSVFSFASQIGVQNDEASSSQMFQYLTRMTLEHSEKLVVVVDNVDSIFEEVSKVIKIVKLFENIFMIVTSRDRIILDNAGVRMELDILSKLGARQILRNSIENLSDSDADSLSDLVQYYPLALQQAVAYVKVQRENYKTPNYSVSDYVKEFNQKKSQMLNHKLNEYEHNYYKTTLVTWDITFDRLSDEAKEFLKILAFLDPDKIKVDFFEKVCIVYKRKCEEAVNMLRNYCLIKVENLVISIHRLVQDVMRGKAESGFAKQLFNVVGIVLARRPDSEYSEFNNDNSHMEKISELAYGAKFRVERRYDASDNSKEILFDIKSRLALKLSEINKHSDCLELCSEVLSSISCLYSTHRNAFQALILLSKNPLSRLLVVEFLENSLELKKLTLGDKNQFTTNFKIVLAVVLETGERKLELVNEIRNYYDFNNGQMQEYYAVLFLSMIIGEDWLTRDKIYRYAEDCRYRHLDLQVLERLLAFYKKVLGENDKLTVKVKNRMAFLLCWKEDYGKSIKLLEQVFNSNIQSECASACFTVDLIAKHFYRNGNYKKAKPLFEKLIKFSEFQNDVINAKYLLANILFELDSDLDYAKDLFCELLFYYEEGRGKYHEDAEEKKEKIKTQLLNEQTAEKKHLLNHKITFLSSSFGSCTCT